MRNEIRIPTILGLLVAFGGLLSGLWLVQGQVSNISKAAADLEPAKVTVTNVTDTSFTVSWITTVAAPGFVEYGTEQNNIGSSLSDDRDQESGGILAYLTHIVTVKGLKPETNYYFKIGSGKKIFDMAGNPYQISTGSVITRQPQADVA